jgi:hypothetical protein
MEMGMFFVLQKVVSLWKYMWQADKVLKECVQGEKWCNWKVTKELMFQGITQEWNWDSSVGVASWLQTGRSDFRNPERVRNFSVLQNLQIGWVAYAASYRGSFLGVKSHRVSNHIGGGGRFFGPIQTGPKAHPSPVQWISGFFHGGRAAEAWRWPLWGLVWQWVRLCLHVPYVPAWDIYLFNLMQYGSIRTLRSSYVADVLVQVKFWHTYCQLYVCVYTWQCSWNSNSITV